MQVIHIDSNFSQSYQCQCSRIQNVHIYLTIDSTHETKKKRWRKIFIHTHKLTDRQMFSSWSVEHYISTSRCTLENDSSGHHFYKFDLFRWKLVRYFIYRIFWRMINWSWISFISVHWTTDTKSIACFRMEKKLKDSIFEVRNKLAREKKITKNVSLSLQSIDKFPSRKSSFLRLIA